MFPIGASRATKTHGHWVHSIGHVGLISRDIEPDSGFYSIWWAKRLGYGNYFIEEDGGYVTDDHLYVNRYGIPSIDIIPCHRDTETGFPPYWHTVDDTMRNIDRSTLKAVGQTVLTVLYEE